MFVNEERLLTTLRKLIAIESPSGHEQTIAGHLAAELKALGGETVNDAVGNVVARFAGEGEPVLLNAHMDTVPVAGPVKIVESEGRWQSDGTTILGADDKAGLAIILEVIRSLGDKGLRHPPLEVVFTVGEEIGFVGAKNLDYSRISSKSGICFDAGGNAIVIAAPSVTSIDVTIKGKAAHAGVSPERGINAIAVAAEAVAALPWGRIDEQTTTNVGMIHGGVARNVVPETVTLITEVRSRDDEKSKTRIDQLLKAFQDAAAKHGAKAEFKQTELCKCFKLEPETDIVKRITEAAATFDLKPSLRAAGAGLDASEFNQRGIKAATLGTGAGLAHSPDEYVVIEAFVRAADLLYTVLKTA